MTQLVVQDPEASEPAFLFEALVDAAKQAVAGGGIFAFASREESAHLPQTKTSGGSWPVPNSTSSSGWMQSQTAGRSMNFRQRRKPCQNYPSAPS